MKSRKIYHTVIQWWHDFHAWSENPLINLHTILFPIHAHAQLHQVHAGYFLLYEKHKQISVVAKIDSAHQENYGWMAGKMSTFSYCQHGFCDFCFENGQLCAAIAMFVTNVGWRKRERPKTRWRHTTETENSTCRLENMEQGQGCTWQQRNVKMTCGGLVCHVAWSRQMRWLGGRDRTGIYLWNWIWTKTEMDTWQLHVEVKWQWDTSWDTGPMDTTVTGSLSNSSLGCEMQEH